ncbi:MAG: hypothetical protein DRH90_18140 [Deltaproteobacteria bacterium]|nr:MAG: hypothetical protein DRH90_18140 [Deltaproteobacteria bacterium]RLC10025.1 MAG: hypothetical protein DRI24_20910 [Deltaproteobacteria bacterium]
MVNLNTAPLVIPKRRVVKVGGVAVGSKDTLNVEMEKQSLSDIQYLLKEITYEDTEQQIRLDNPPTRVAVDNRENKPVSQAEWKTEVQFGQIIDHIMIRTVQRELINAIRRTTQERTGALQDIHNWEWVYYSKKGKRGVKVNPFKIEALPSGARLVLRPTSKIPYASWANMWVAKQGTDFTPSRGKNKGVTRTRNEGFMAQAIAKFKRSQFAKSYTMWVSFSKKYQTAGDTYPHGSPAITIMARRTRRSYRRRL